MARRLGERVGRELNIPVYLYEEAATQPDRVNLENIRRGQYEGLKAEIETNPERKPDFGPARLGPAGATVIGARHPLIAYNVYLNTGDVSVAKAIAKAVRQSSGGLPCVKALGMLVEGMAQVSMNLTNFRQTPSYRVVEAIRREAARYGVRHPSQRTGRTDPAGCLDRTRRSGTCNWTDFKPDQILEQRLYSATSEPGSGSRFILPGRSRRSHPHSRRRFRRRPRRGDGRSPGRHGGPADNRQEEICRLSKPR